MKCFLYSWLTTGCLLLAALLSGAAGAVHAQALNYPALNASSRAGTYTDLGTNGTVIGTANFDDASSAATDIGFTFSFGGSTFTQFVLNTNGYLKLGSTAPAGPFFTPYVQVATGGPFDSADNFLISPFNADLEAGTGTPEYRVYTSGTAPNRVCTVQWKNVSDKSGRLLRPGSPYHIDKQFTNFSFQARLYEGTNVVEFGYTTTTLANLSDGINYNTVGLKGASTAQAVVAIKPENYPWSDVVFKDGRYSASDQAFCIRSNSGVGNPQSTVLPDAGRTIRFGVPVANDAAVLKLYNLEKLPAGQGYAYSALIGNLGTTTLSNVAVTLTLSGANAATQTQPLPSLAAGATTVVTFPTVTLPNAGATTVSVSVPADGSNDNNSQEAGTVVTSGAAASFSYINPNVLFYGRYGYTPNSSGTTYTAAFTAAIQPTAAFTITDVRARLASGSALVGQQVYGVVYSLSGALLGRSATYTLQTADPGTVHNFALQAAVNVPAGTKVVVGMAQVVRTAYYYPMAVQFEAPTRPGAFYDVFVSGSGAPDDVTNYPPADYRYGLEAVGYGTALATASPALARALALYPNPNATGVFTLEVPGLPTGSSLAVSVVNQLGQVVHRTAAPGNAPALLDLSNLSAGLYHVRVDCGGQYATRLVSITR